MQIDVFSLAITVLTTGLSAWLSVYLYFNSIDRNLRLLISKDKTELTYYQAASLAELYVFHVQAMIKIKVDRYIDKHFHTHITSQHIPMVEEFIEHVTENTISTAKDKFEKFRIFGGQSFSDFVTELLMEKDAVTNQTKDKAVILFEECAKAGLCGEPLKAKFKILIVNSGKESKRRIINKLKEQYNYKHE